MSGRSNVSRSTVLKHHMHVPTYFPVWSFVLYERPILEDEPKPHKSACSGRLHFSVTEA